MLLVGMFGLNSWVVMEVLYFRIIQNEVPYLSAFWSPKEVLLAKVLLGVYGFLLVNAVGSLSFCWVLANFAKGYRMPSGRIAPRPRIVMQTDFDISLRFDFQSRGTDGNRPNYCRQRCANAGAWRGDRMYHCRHGYDRCLPVFDHYCFWLWVPVYLNTIKSYCLFMPLLFLYSTFSAGVASWAMFLSELRGLTRWGYAVVFLGAGFAIVASADMWKYQWNMLVLQNRVGKERDRTWHWTMSVRNINGRLMFDEPKSNPYSLGSRWANAQEVLGLWYQLPFWFWQPARVGQYADHQNLDCDTTISPAYMIHANELRLRHMPANALDLDAWTESPVLSPLPPGVPHRRHNASDLV
ncbi:DHHC zinc finger domain-containing protein [Colletotrichum caudatum]|nr:DHHC zinc finger domain-containing protein [Colletotrichum caudatum]